MIKYILTSVLFISLSSTLLAQEEEEPKFISRTVEGEVRGLYGDTLYGDVKIREATKKHITSIFFKKHGGKKEIYTAHDIKRFKMIVPFPERASFGVEELYYKSFTDPKNSQKKYFVPLDEWK